jgi:hypothetical protein
MSTSFSVGLVGVSIQTSFVLGRNAVFNYIKRKKGVHSTSRRDIKVVPTTHLADICEVDEGRLNVILGQHHFTKQTVGASVEVVHGNHVVGRIQRVHESAAGGQAFEDARTLESCFLKFIGRTLPDEKVMACFAPSSAARHCSKTFLVGLPLLPYSNLAKKRFPFFHFGDKMNWGRLNCLKSAGPSCLKVVAKDIGGTTDIEVHCSGSCPTCKALVAKWSSFLR